MKSLSCVRLFATPLTVACQAPLSMGFSRQEYWSGLPFPPPRDLPNPGIKPRYRALRADSLPSEPPGKSGFKHKPSLQTPVPYLLLLTSSKFRMFQDVKSQMEGFPGGSVVKNLPAIAGDMGWMPCLGRSPVPHISQACGPQPLCLCSRAWEPQLLSPPTLEPVPCNNRYHGNEKPKLCSSVLASACHN